jgi:hypothetical protein
MQRLQQVDEPHQPHHITSISVTPEMNRLLQYEMVRVGVNSRSKLINMILEEYFTQPV